MRYLHRNVSCICGLKCRTIVNIIKQPTLIKIPKMQHILPNSSQRPFPKIAGKGPAVDSPLKIGYGYGSRILITVHVKQ